MERITDLADQAVILPLAATVAAALALAGWRRGALAWCAVIGWILALMLVLKLASAACGHLLPGGELQSPSGHTAAAGAVYGGLLAGLVQRLAGHGRWTAACAAAAALVVGASRLALGMHTAVDVLVGGAVGVGGAMALTRLAGVPPLGMRLAPVAAAALVVIVAFHAFHLVAEAAIRDATTRVWPLSGCSRTNGMVSTTRFPAHAGF
jgi:membrane-associated phospholipid phosphatase